MKQLKNIGIALCYLGLILFLARDVPPVRRVWCSIADILVSGSAARISRCPQDPPTTAYRKVSMNGFTVLIHPQYQNQLDLEEALQALQQSLDQLVEIIPSTHLPVLQKVAIWLEPAPGSATADSGEVTGKAATFYHYPASTLVNMGLNPDKAGGMGIFDLTAFSQESAAWRLRLVLHELAHAYQYQQLGRDYAPVNAAYRQAVERQLYKAVEHSDGYIGEGYAIYSQFEYFAELSVAYFAEGQYYPFTRSELKAHDPVGYRLMQTTWGDIQD